MTHRITHQSLTETKTVAKPWGQEKWIQQGAGDHTYVLKEIVLLAGNKTSLQVHKFKAETNYILEGHGELVYSNVKLDCDKYVAGKYSPQELDAIISDLQFQKYGPGSVMTIEPGTIHRMIAHTDLRFVEASTTHLDDVIRLQDDANRTHGRIDSEHT
jgi:mannose-6-phosphate isomerase-like protein (cupin superfamily)